MPSPGGFEPVGFLHLSTIVIMRLALRRALAGSSGIVRASAGGLLS